MVELTAILIICQTLGTLLLGVLEELYCFAFRKESRGFFAEWQKTKWEPMDRAMSYTSTYSPYEWGEDSAWMMYLVGDLLIGLGTLLILLFLKGWAIPFILLTLVAFGIRWYTGRNLND